jgi:hypothetical protein
MRHLRQGISLATKPFFVLWKNMSIIHKLKSKAKYHTYKLESEIDLFTCILDYRGSNSTTIFQIESTDIFYKPLYFSDGDLTDINIYYVKSKNLKNATEISKVIKFNPGTSEWHPAKDLIEETHGWIFISRVLDTSSTEIQQILQLEEKADSK